MHFKTTAFLFLLLTGLFTACAIEEDEASDKSNLALVGGGTLDFGEADREKSFTLKNDCPSGCPIVDFTATADKIWINVEPADGSLGQDETATLLVTIDRQVIPVGQFDGKVTVNGGGAAIDVLIAGEMAKEIAGNEIDDDHDGVTDEESLDARCQTEECVPSDADPTVDICGRCTSGERCDQVEFVCVDPTTCPGIPCGSECCGEGEYCDALTATCKEGEDPTPRCNPECPAGLECMNGLCKDNNASHTSCGWHRSGEDANAEMCKLPSGTYSMGCNETDTDCTEAANPRVSFNLTASWAIDRFEVTNARYEAYLDATTASAPLCEDGASFFDDNNNLKEASLAEHPVVCVTPTEAQLFCEWAGKQLPTEAQWEAAARSNDKRIYPWGDDFNGDNAQCYYPFDDSIPYDPSLHCSDLYENDTCLFPDDRHPQCETTAPVVYKGEPTKPEGMSPFGLTHMAGNIAEWVADEWTDDHSACHPGGCGDDPFSDPMENADRILKGGSYMDDKSGITSFSRVQSASDFTSPYAGFRCATSFVTE